MDYEWINDNQKHLLQSNIALYVYKPKLLSPLF